MDDDKPEGQDSGFNRDPHFQRVMQVKTLKQLMQSPRLQ